ncbi:hypothetical protein CLAIMM_05663 [Cladophialophora immunda]|nr:hypothetical protein CLAIMM_05663 [Cladophialophora immunda]
MTSRESGLLLNLPLTVVANILGHLDTFEELRHAVLSNRIFHNALRENFHTTASKIITRHIPELTMPYALCLLETTHTVPEGETAVSRILQQLARRVGSQSETRSAVHTLSLPEYHFLERTYKAVHDLTALFKDKTIPRLTKCLGIQRSNKITTREQLRVERAFFRYQIMCTLFCRKEGSLALADQSDSQFFNEFSPWVNEQLICVYIFLERSVAEAFEDLAAHDVEWGELPVDWDEDADQSPPIQEMLTNGLPFLRAVAGSKSYEERITVMRLEDCVGIASDRWPSALRYLAVNQDGDDDELLGCYDELTPRQEALHLAERYPLFEKGRDSSDLGPSITWLEAHWGQSLLTSVFNTDDWNLWLCGYVMWDFDDASMLYLRDKCDELRLQPRDQYRPRDAWEGKDIERSERQRTDIYFAGGRGYWPQYGPDFSKIRGLDVEKQGELTKKWRLQGILDA